MAADMLELQHWFKTCIAPTMTVSGMNFLGKSHVSNPRREHPFHTKAKHHSHFHFMTPCNINATRALHLLYIGLWTTFAPWKGVARIEQKGRARRDRLNVILTD